MRDRSNGKSSETQQYRGRRTDIIDAAATLFARKGYSATGIREISEKVGLDLGGLYYYIESKESLLEDIHDLMMDPLLEASRKIEAMDITASARLRLISESMLRNIIERPDHAWVTFHEYRAFSEARRERFRQKRLDFEVVVSNLLSTGASVGELHVGDIHSATMAFIGMHNHSYLWVGHERTIDPKALSTTYCDIFFNGIGVHDRKAESAGAERGNVAT